MERLLKDFNIEPKNPSDESERRWRESVSLVKNPRRRFRNTADLSKRVKLEAIKEKTRIQLYVSKAALQFKDTVNTVVPGSDKPEFDSNSKQPSVQVDFGIDPDSVASPVRSSYVRKKKVFFSEWGVIGGVSTVTTVVPGSDKPEFDSDSNQSVQVDFGIDPDSVASPVRSSYVKKTKPISDVSDWKVIRGVSTTTATTNVTTTVTTVVPGSDKPEFISIRPSVQVDFGIDPDSVASPVRSSYVKTTTKISDVSDWKVIGGVGTDNAVVQVCTEAKFDSIQPSVQVDLASLVHSYDVNGLKRMHGVKGVARTLEVSMVDGVSEDSANTRQHYFGFNRYAEKQSKSFFTFVWEALQDSTLMILLVCSLVLIGVRVAVEGWAVSVYDGVGIILGVFLVVIFTAANDYQQSLMFREWNKEKNNISVQVTRDGKRQKISIYDLVVGDIVHLSIGDQIPADGIYISGHSFHIDESSLTGEIEPVNVNEDNPFLLSGTKVQDGSGKMLVAAVGMRTYWGEVMEILNEGGEEETPLQVKLNGVATIIGKIGLSVALLTFFVLMVRFLVEKAIHGEFTDRSLEDAMKVLNYFTIAVTMIVIAVPEGLPLAVTLNLAFATRCLMSDKALVRRLSACEAMGSASYICLDKTGTLTSNHMVVDKLWISGEVVETKDIEYGEKLETKISEGVLNILLQALFQNNAAEIVKDKHGKITVLGMPTDSALLELGLHLAGDTDVEYGLYKKLKIEPFNPVQKKMSVLVRLPDGGLRVFCKGASDIILKMCDKIIDCNGVPVDFLENHAENVKDIVNAFASKTLRTLCLAFKDINTEAIISDNGYTLLAIVGIKDPLRPDVKHVVQTCLAAGVTVAMVTGDDMNIARSVAAECGILTKTGVAIEGEQYRNLYPKEKESIIPRIQVMARSLPHDKHSFVDNLKSIFGEVVVATGDGTSDAPALHEADIGVAMGLTGTEVAKENADIILMDDNIKTIITIIKWGRAVYINIQKLVQFQLTVIIVALVINFVTAFVTGYVPLTAVQLLWVNLNMDILCALALATEPLNDELLKRPPVGRGEKFITNNMWRNIIGQSIYQIIVLTVLNFEGKNILSISGSDTTEVLRTLIFNSFIFFQVFNEINCREMEKINIFRGIFESWTFLVIIFSTVATQVIIVQFLGNFSCTVPLNSKLWLVSVLIGATSMPIACLLKCIPVKRDVSIHHDSYEPLPTHS